jgi:hypothetical protein
MNRMQFNPNGAMKAMSHTNSSNQPRSSAVAALNSLLTQVSAIKLKDIGLGWPAAGNALLGSEIDILAHVEVFGRSHTLACQISSGSGERQVRATLEELQDKIAYLPGKVTPVIILPVLSHEVQALCDQNKTGCLDLHGNGRLAIDEIFISIRSLPRRALRQPASVSASSSLRFPVRAAEKDFTQRLLLGIPSALATLPDRASHSARQARPR